MSDRATALTWLAATIGGTWFFMSKDPELELLPTAIFAGMVAAILVGLVAHLVPGKKRASAR